MKTPHLLVVLLCIVSPSRPARAGVDFVRRPPVANPSGEAVAPANPDGDVDLDVPAVTPREPDVLIKGVINGGLL